MNIHEITDNTAVNPHPAARGWELSLFGTTRKEMVAHLNTELRNYPHETPEKSVNQLSSIMLSEVQHLLSKNRIAEAGRLINRIKWLMRRSDKMTEVR